MNLFEIKLNIDTTDIDLHSDIVIFFLSIEKQENIDSYYLFDGVRATSKKNHFKRLGLKLIDKLRDWIFVLDNKILSKDSLFIIDVSDEYIGAFRLTFTNERNSSKLSYGVIKNPIPFEIKNIVCQFDSSLFIELYNIGEEVLLTDFKGSIQNSIDLIIHQISKIG